MGLLLQWLQLVIKLVFWFFWLTVACSRALRKNQDGVRSIRRIFICMRTKKILNFECETKEVVVYYPTRIACSHEGHAKKAPLFIFLIIIFRFLMLFFPLLCLSLGNGRKSNDFKQKLMGKWCFPRRSQNIAGPVIFSVFLWSPSAAKVNSSREKVLDSGVDLETAGPWFDSPPRRFFFETECSQFLRQSTHFNKYYRLECFMIFWSWNFLLLLLLRCV